MPADFQFATRTQAVVGAYIIRELMGMRMHSATDGVRYLREQSRIDRRKLFISPSRCAVTMTLFS